MEGPCDGGGGDAAADNAVNERLRGLNLFKMMIKMLPHCPSVRRTI